MGKIDVDWMEPALGSECTWRSGDAQRVQGFKGSGSFDSA